MIVCTGMIVAQGMNHGWMELLSGEKRKEVTIMNAALQDRRIRGRVYLPLEDKALNLTSQDLLNISKVVNRVQGRVRIRQGSWQVLLDVPMIHFQKLTQGLLEVGYRHSGHFERVNETSTFLLGGLPNETPF
jgi:hypothetical protein